MKKMNLFKLEVLQKVTKASKAKRKALRKSPICKKQSRNPTKNKRR